MDHLQMPDNPTLPPIEVPFLCAHEQVCIASCFFQWPTEQGWEKTWMQTSSQDIIASRIQSWLYFGLLAAFLDQDFNREEFTKVGTSSYNVVDSSSLKQHIEQWRTNCQSQIHLVEDE